MGDARLVVYPVEQILTEFTEPSKLEELRISDTGKKELSDELLEELLLKAEFPDGLNNRVLDFGCGTGTLIRKHLIPLTERTGCLVYGIDTSKTMIEFAKQQTTHPRVHYVLANNEDSQFEKDSFDFIICTFVFEYVNNAERLLPNLLKWLNPGGKLWLTTTADVKCFQFFKILKEHSELGKYSQNLPEPDWLPNDSCQKFYESHLKIAGFEIIEIQTYPTLGLEYETIDGFIEFFVWVGMGATSIPKALKPTLKQVCSNLVRKWIQPDDPELSLEWKTLVFTAQKLANI